MRHLPLALAAPTLLLAGAVHAQFVKGNEAVVGSKVETPPLQSSMLKVCAADEACHAGSWRMVETPEGLVECTEPFARPGSCRKSTYGSQKLRRVWVVKKGGAWFQCQYPDINSKCAAMSSHPPANLPVDAVQ